MRAPRHIAGHGQQVTVHVDGDLVREAGRIAARRTLMEVRDLMSGIPTEKPESRVYDRKPVDAAKYRDELLAGLQRLMEATDEQ